MNGRQLSSIQLIKFILLLFGVQSHIFCRATDSLTNTASKQYMNAANRNDITIELSNETIHKPLTKLKQSTYTNRTEINHRSFNVVTHIENVLERSSRSAFTIRMNSSTMSLVKSDEKPSRNDSNYSQRPLFGMVRKYAQLSFDPSTYKCNDKQMTECQNKTNEFRAKIITELKKALIEPIDVSANKYNVEYEHPDDMIKYNPTCMVLDAKLRTLTNKDSPFDGNKIGRMFPKKKLFGKKYLSMPRSCVIVSSAGALYRSGLGKFIDLHDIVLRFNHAPTKGHENDVGTKTTIRVVNSQVVSKKEFNFVNSPIFENVSIAAWDPGKYNGSLSDWIKNPDFQLFKNYKRFMKRRPDAKFYLLDPRSIWNLWKMLHIYTGLKIRQNPPSSGFIGLALLLPYCSYVDIVEYIPSTRLTSRCHYYDSEMNSACTFGAWHPLAAEKLMTFDMNSANNFSTFQSGIVRIRKPKSNGCN